MAEERFLTGKVALVRGASSGAVVDIARELARFGARVAVHYRHSRAGADVVVEAIRAAGRPRPSRPTWRCWWRDAARRSRCSIAG